MWMRRPWGVAYCAVADRHLAEDAAQEAFAIASHELARLPRADEFGSWICTISKRVAARILEKHGRKPA